MRCISLLIMPATFLFTSVSAYGQSDARAEVSALMPWADMLVADTNPQHRQMASDTLFLRLQHLLSDPASMSLTFDSIPQVSVLQPADGAFRLFTWQLSLSDSTFVYKGFLQQRQPSGVRLWALDDRKSEMSGWPVDAESDPEFWYGALYYNMHPMELKDKRRAYLLFGYDGFSRSERRKLIDVLWFDPADGSPHFGLPIFSRSEDNSREPEHRFMLQYYAESFVRLNWDTAYNMILFDHLISMPSPYDGSMTYLPDGSYQGFKVEKGRLQFVDRAFHDVQQTAPRPFPILDRDKSKDIMGRDRRKKQ